MAVALVVEHFDVAVVLVSPDFVRVEPVEVS